jgi:hypothetical protein
MWRKFARVQYLTNVDVLAQATFDGGKVIINRHAFTRAFCMNWRMGSEVR